MGTEPQELHGPTRGKNWHCRRFKSVGAHLVLSVVVWLCASNWLPAAACLEAPAFAQIMGVKCRAVQSPVAPRRTARVS